MLLFLSFFLSATLWQLFLPGVAEFFLLTQLCICCSVVFFTPSSRTSVISPFIATALSLELFGTLHLGRASAALLLGYTISQFLSGRTRITARFTRYCIAALASSAIFVLFITLPVQVWQQYIPLFLANLVAIGITYARTKQRSLISGELL